MRKTTGLPTHVATRSCTWVYAIWRARLIQHAQPTLSRTRCSPTILTPPLNARLPTRRPAILLTHPPAHRLTHPTPRCCIYRTPICRTAACGHANVTCRKLLLSDVLLQRWADPNISSQPERDRLRKKDGSVFLAQMQKRLRAAAASTRVLILATPQTQALRKRR